MSLLKGRSLYPFTARLSNSNCSGSFKTIRVFSPSLLQARQASLEPESQQLNSNISLFLLHGEMGFHGVCWSCCFLIFIFIFSEWWDRMQFLMHCEGGLLFFWECWGISVCSVRGGLIQLCSISSQFAISRVLFQKQDIGYKEGDHCLWL